MSQLSIPCRFDDTTAAFLKSEAAREGVSQSEFIRRMVARGLLAQSLHEAVSEIRAIAPGGITVEGFRFLLVNLLETRNLLRIVADKHFPGAAAGAQHDATEEVRRLVGDEMGDAPLGDMPTC